jgi:uncharacterized membrane protein YbaN (DUF454 family)
LKYSAVITTLRFMQERMIIPDYCPVPEAKPYARPLLIAFGWLCVALGTIGVVTPGLPTTVFIIMAAWAFARSSRRFHDWLFNHRLFGLTLINWERNRVIPAKAKVMAVSMMSLSVLAVAILGAGSWMAPAILMACMTPVAFYIVTRASRVSA